MTPELLCAAENGKRSLTILYSFHMWKTYNYADSFGCICTLIMSNQQIVINIEGYSKVDIEVELKVLHQTLLCYSYYCFVSFGKM